MPIDTRMVPMARSTSSRLRQWVRRPQWTEAAQPRSPRSRIPYQITIQYRRPTIIADLARTDLGGVGAYVTSDRAGLPVPSGLAAAGTAAAFSQLLEGVDAGIVSVTPTDAQAV